MARPRCQVPSNRKYSLMRFGRQGISQMTTKSGQYDYVLRGGAQGAERLRLLAAVKWPTTKILLDRSGLRPGMHCLDVGCGIGAVAFRMAEIVGATGRVVGMDIDERCIELAR